MSNQRYSAEFRDEAVRQVLDRGYSVKEVPKRSDLSDHSQADLNKIALRLNQRPRKTLGFRCPADKLDEIVASTT
jgi:IS30 family transposase